MSDGQDPKEFDRLNDIIGRPGEHRVSLESLDAAHDADEAKDLAKRDEDFRACLDVFERVVRRAALKKACKAVCQGCARDWEFEKETGDHRSSYDVATVSGSSFYRCRALKIRALMEDSDDG